jgi:hypothetical protein
MAALAIIPCLVLMRAESNARKAARMVGVEDPDLAVVESGAAAEALV